MNAEDRVKELELEVARLRATLEQFVRACYVVEASIDPRGHRWCEPWLDEALDSAVVALRVEPTR